MKPQPIKRKIKRNVKVYAVMMLNRNVIQGKFGHTLIIFNRKTTAKSSYPNHNIIPVVITY